MLIRVHGATLHGIDGVPVEVEVDAGRGLPAFHIVGQPDRVVNESRDRIRAAFRQSGLEFPPGRVTVNLAPTDMPKAGAALDLPIAVGIAATRLDLPHATLARTLFVGELGLDGVLRGVRGTLAMLACADGRSVSEAVVPLASLDEAAICPGIRVRGGRSLIDVVAALRGSGELCTPGELSSPGGHVVSARAPEGADLAEVRGQETARRALEVAAAGRHNALLIGPPGSGKTLLVHRLPGLLPNLPFTEALEATRVHSVAGTLGGRSLIERPPFRAPHHTTSDVGMVGGGRPLRPGEISLAHRGVLFLDELPEFRRPVLEALRQPLEEGEIRLVRAHGAVRLPARFQLIAAMNPCPCGFRGAAGRECRCDDPQVARYLAKLSGPLLDRIDLHVPVTPVPWEKMTRSGPDAEPSRTVAARVARARELQRRRYTGEPYQTNAELPAAALRRHCPVSGDALRLLERAVRQLALSMRAYVRILRVARTLADLADARDIAAEHVAEAAGYRQLERRA